MPALVRVVREHEPLIHLPEESISTLGALHRTWRVGMQRQLGLREIPDKQRITQIAEAWRPYRTIATWYLWRSFGPVPQSE